MAAASAIALALVCAGSGCVRSPLSGTEFASRSTPIAVDFLFPKGGVPGATDWIVAYNYVKADGKHNPGTSYVSGAVSDLTTDAEGTTWQELTGNLEIPLSAWIRISDPWHPNAKWKLTVDFIYGGVTYKPRGSTVSAYTPMLVFAGNPDGTFTTATSNCINQNASSGRNIAMNCNSGTRLTVYARND